MIRRPQIALSFAVALALATVSLSATPAATQDMRQALIARLKARSAASQPLDPTQYLPGATAVAAAYGDDPAQTLEIYAPPHAQGLPVIVMVHGGGWRIGDKNVRGTVDSKLKYWLPKGYVIVSVDYRMLPQSTVDVQARDVATAVSYVEAHAGDWGADGHKLILMGHSAGAHLAALLSANPSWVTGLGGHPWRGTVVLDSAIYDVAAHLSAPRHPKLYDDAFGSDPAFWAKVSPTAQIKPDAIQMMLVCSTKRPDDSCGQAHAFADALKSVGMDVPVQPEALTHMQVNDTLGDPGNYTEAVNTFILQRLR